MMILPNDPLMQISKHVAIGIVIVVFVLSSLASSYLQRKLLRVRKNRRK